jgi:glutamine---fructose-6-phosphate transaminase (isomerizing)
MCGIVAATAETDIVSVLINGLKALEYRGYDSAGICVATDAGLQRLRAKGKVRDLEALQAATPLAGHFGIAHTRWATHGAPNTANAHPHISGLTSVVHNGIVENHAELRAELVALGYVFSSDTDTEVIAHLIEHAQLAQSCDLLAATQSALSRLRGAYAIAVVSMREPGRVIGARAGSPLVLGVAQAGGYLASDIYALLAHTRQFVYLHDGDVVDLRRDQHQIYSGGLPVSRPLKRTELSAHAVERGEYRHFMLKEIHEQPVAVADTLEGRIAGGKILTEILGVDARAMLNATKAVQIVACGSSFHAALVARHWIESFSGLPCLVEIASEYRYRDAAVIPGTLFVTVSQSGETVDTLEALKLAKSRGYMAMLAVCNVPESSLVRESDLVLMTRAGPEIGVASTKAFLTQLVAFALVALELGRAHGMAPERYADAVRQLEALPNAIAEALKQNDAIKTMSGAFAQKQHALFLGRGQHFPIALEGALKLKEISYIHAEAYPAGELKHGPLALVDKNMPVIAVAPNDKLLEKLKSNLQEVRARGGEMFVFADAQVAPLMSDDAQHLITLPACGEFVAPILFTVPLQLLAYHVAVLRGTDVDQPRNLAKSVTVE